MNPLNSLTRAKFRVKLKSLAAEAKIIREKERRAARHARAWYWEIDRQLKAGASPNALSKERTGMAQATLTNEGLHGHRIGILRDEARATLLAYAFLRGVPYKATEPRAKKPVSIKRVTDISKSLAWDQGILPSAQAVLDWVVHPAATQQVA